MANKYVCETHHLVDALYLKLGVSKELWADGLKGKSVGQILNYCHFAMISQHIFCVLSCWVFF